MGGFGGRAGFNQRRNDEQEPHLSRDRHPLPHDPGGGGSTRLLQEGLRGRGDNAIPVSLGKARNRHRPLFPPVVLAAAPIWAGRPSLRRQRDESTEPWPSLLSPRRAIPARVKGGLPPPPFGATTRAEFANAPGPMLGLNRV